jgi:hypothetical protein
MSFLRLVPLLCSLLLPFQVLVLGGSWAIDRVGDWLGGQGRFWPTVLGMVLGSLAGAGVAILVAPLSEAAPIFPAVVGPALGGAISLGRGLPSPSHGRQSPARQ